MIITIFISESYQCSQTLWVIIYQLFGESHVFFLYAAFDIKQGIVITSPKKAGKENLFDGKTDSNTNPLLSVPPAQEKPKKMKRKRVQQPQNEAEENTTIDDQNVTQHLEKPKKIKRKRVELMQDSTGVSDQTLYEKKQKKIKLKGLKEIVGENIINGTSLNVSSAQQLQNETEANTIIHDQNVTQQSEDNQCSDEKKNDLNSFKAGIPLPTGSELVTIAGVELQKEDAGNALQLLEFCSTFGKVTS